MSDNFVIKGYTAESREVYEVLKSENVTVSQLKKLDTNSDMKITEDDLVEFIDDDSTNTSTSTSLNLSSSEQDNLINQYEAKLKELYTLYNRLNKQNNRQDRLNSQLSRLDDDDEDANSRIQSKLSDAQSRISEINSSINQCMNDMTNLVLKMTQLQTANYSPNGVMANQSLNSAGSPQASLTLSSTAITPTGEIPSNLSSRVDAKLGQGFSAKLESISTEIGCNPNDLLAMMYSESGLSSTITNSIGAVGLIQFIPSTLKANGYTSSQVRNMSPVQQLDVVKDIMLKSKAMSGYSSGDKIDAGTLYALCFLPAAAKNEVLSSKGGKLGWAYSSNSPLDLDKNGDISKTDLANRLKSKYQELLKNI